MTNYIKTIPGLQKALDKFYSDHDKYFAKLDAKGEYDYSDEEWKFREMWANKYPSKADLIEENQYYI